MKLIKGIYLPDSDTHFEYHLVNGPEFESCGTYQFKKIKKALDVVQSHKPEFNIAVDVGAHIGLWTRVLGYYFNSTHAFEPVDEFRDCLNLNVKGCHLNEVLVYDYAVAAMSGLAVTMNKVMDNTGQTHVRPVTKGGMMNTPEHPLVTTVALDSMDFGGHVDFLKLDVEGYELEVLKGARRILTEDKPIIVLEQKSGNAERYGTGQHDALNYLKQMGYEPVWEMSGDHCVEYKG